MYVAQGHSNQRIEDVHRLAQPAMIQSQPVMAGMARGLLVVGRNFERVGDSARNLGKPIALNTPKWL